MSSADAMTNELAQRLRERRDELILTQRELAEYLGVSERTVQAWELAESFPRPKHRRALLAWLRDGREDAA